MADDWSAVPQSVRNRLRDFVFERDDWTCQLREEHVCAGPLELDHVVPVSMGGALLDAGNLRAMCRRGNRSRDHHGRGDVWRWSKARIVLVVGPVAAGKSTFVRDRAAPEDLVVDYDAMSLALGPALPRGSTARHDEIMAMRRALLSLVRRGKTSAERVWIVSTHPRAEEFYPHHEVMVVDPGLDVVREQFVRAGRPEKLWGLVEEWYRVRAGGPGGRVW